MKNSSKRSVVHSALLMCMAIVVGLLIRYYICEVRIVLGESMLPTLQQGNIVLVNKLDNNYETMDVVVIAHGKSAITKRIVGCPGDTVQIKGGIVYINGSPLQDVTSETTDYPGIAKNPITLRENEYFVLGDNRSHSCDSRYATVGIVNQEDIVGRVSVSAFPFKNLQQK